MDPSRFELADLTRLPVMTKAKMMAEFDAVVTDRRLSKHQVEQHLAASLHEPSLLLDEYVCLASGGSSGTRGIFVQTLSEFAGLGRIDHAPGIRQGTGRRRAAARRPSARHGRRRLARALQWLRHGRSHRAAGPAHPSAGHAAAG